MAKTRKSEEAFEFGASAAGDISRVSAREKQSPAAAAKKKEVGICIRVPEDIHRWLRWHKFVTDESINKLVVRLLHDEMEKWDIPDDVLAK